MKRSLQSLLFLLLCSGIHAQTELMIVRVKDSYAVINAGTNQGVRVGDIFKFYTPGSPNQYGEVEVIKPMTSISAIKLISGYAGYILKVGDQQIPNEDAVV